MQFHQDFLMLFSVVATMMLLQPFAIEAFVPKTTSEVNTNRGWKSPSSSSPTLSSSPLVVASRQPISSVTISRISTDLNAVAKSGGRMIETEEQYNKAVLKEGLTRPVLVFFSAPWCGPCRLTNPVVKEVMKQFLGKIDVVEVCTDDLAEVAEQAGVVSIPTIQFYYGGKVLETIVGCVAKSVLANAADKVLEDVQLLQQQRAP